MIVQADGVRFTPDRDPATAREAAKVVADTGPAALEEMRRLAAPLASVPPARRALSRPVVESLGAD